MPNALSILTGQYERLPMAGGHAAIELDLGCGKGGYLLELARRFPDRLIIGADVMVGRLRKIKRKAERRDLANVMLLRVEAWSLLPLLPDGALDRIHILCPDPWPKARHRAHRLITSEFLGRLAGKLTATGVLHLATDNGPYLATMRAAMAGSNRRAGSRSRSLPPPGSRPRSRSATRSRCSSNGWKIATAMRC